jgi:formate hydrogenlyase transcriptional activator
MSKKPNYQELEQRVRELEDEVALRVGAEKAAEERLLFDPLLLEISAKFVNLPARGVDREIKHGLQRVVEALGVDRSTLFEFSEEMDDFRVSHSWATDGLEPLPSVVASKYWPYAIHRVRRGDIWKFSGMEDLPPEATVEREFYLRTGMKSALAIPLSVGGAIMGVLAISTDRSERMWPDELVQRLRLLGEVFANALQRKRGEEALDKAFAEIERLRKQLQMENLYLREEIKLEHEHTGIVGRSDVIKAILKQVEQVANTGSTVLIQGETGTGKELIARAIHDLSPRRGRALVKVNCAALPSTLIESELFGREKGAFTGALSTQTGRFEVADGSTIFLDEVGELSLEVQAKLLRVLQEGEFERLGSSKTTKVDARVIAATNRDLEEAVRQGPFRSDLYYRLNVFPILVPPLREHPEDIPPLVWHFLRELGERMGKRVDTIPKRSMEAMTAYGWPGNVRELMNVLERAMILEKGTVLHVELGGPAVSADPATTNLTEIERNHMLKVLDMTGWRIRGKNGAAELLGLKPTTLHSRMKKLGIKRET